MAGSKPTTAPAFQFYPRDFLSSPKVLRMSLTEVGIYIKLLSHCWLDNGLPVDVRKLAGMVGIKPQQFERLWPVVLSECFYERAGRLHNVRLDQERKKQAEYRRRQSDRAAARWAKERDDATAMPRQSRRNATPALTRQSRRNALQSSSSSSSAESTQNPSGSVDSAEAFASTPTFLTFPTVGASPSWDLHDGRVESWLQAYPNIDVRLECRKALVWIEAKPERRKTPGGMPKFLVGWLNRAVDVGPAPFPSTGSVKTAGNLDAARRFASR